jgi:Carboxypeptidase regulatory-like domain
MKFLRSLAFIAILFAGVSASFAQTTTTGAVNGVITDQSGAVIAGATVTITDLSTGAVTTVKSNASGSYRFDLLQPGGYQITVLQPGFEKYVSKIQVDASKVLDGNLKLTIGSDTQTITVASSGALIEAENGNVSNTVSETVVEEVPNSGNNLLFETKITPGFNTNFGVVGNTMYQIDGENFNDPYNNANNSGASNLTLGLNDVQEATITANGYSGQFGGLVGATASFVSKQGANRLHGDASYFWTGRSLIANTFSHKEFAKTSGITPRSFENANQWSGMISGPVVIPHVYDGRNKLFFLADAEGLRAILPASPTTVQLPSANLENYITNTALPVNDNLKASVPYYTQMFGIYNTAASAHNAQPGNQALTNQTTPTAKAPIAFLNAKSTGCPTTVGALSIKDLQGLGFVVTPGAVIGGVQTYTASGPTGACSQYYASTATTFANEALEIFRVDYNLGTKDKMFVRYEHDAGVQPTSTDPVDAAFNTISIQPQHDGQFNETHTFGTKATNNFILAGLWYGALFGPANLAADLAVFPAQLSVSDGSLTTLNAGITSYPTGRNITTVQVQDDFALSEGAHTLKFGAKGYFIKENDHYFTAGTVPGETVTTLGAFINGGSDPGSSTGFTTFAQTFPLKPNHPVGIDQWAVYGEDDWKASHALSVTAALRLEHQGNIKCLDNCLTELAQAFPTEAHSNTGANLLALPYNQAYAFNQENVLPGLQELEWEPRIGFAYNPPFFHESMVVRGGYGIFYDGLAASVLEGVAKNPPAKNTFSVANDNLAPNEKTNLWSDTAAYNTAYQAGITTGGTYATIKASAPTSVQANFTPPSVYAAQPNFKMYSVQKWNLEIQKQFGKKTMLSVNYLGNRGEHKPYTNAGLNAGISPTGTQVAGLPTGTAPVAGVTSFYTGIDPRFNQVYYFVSGGSNNYNGVITTVTQKLGGSSTITAGYTYGKILDTGANGFSTSTATGTTDIGAPPDPYNPNKFYGPAATDERHNLVIDYVYKEPFKFGNPYVDMLAGGWQVAGSAFAYSGLPFTVIDTTTTSAISAYPTATKNTLSNGYGGSLLATYIGGGEANCNYALQACLTGSQFGSATSVGLNGPRNAFRGPKYVTTDFSLTKSIPLHWEGGQFQVAAQAFNVLNHLNFSKPTGSLSSGTFGEVTSVINPSGIFSGVGGDDSPRILQLKAKVVF